MEKRFNCYRLQKVDKDIKGLRMLRSLCDFINKYMDKIKFRNR